MFQSGINNRRLCFNLQNAELSDTNKLTDRLSIHHQAFNYLLDYTTLETVTNPLLTTHSDISMIIHATDVNRSFAFQCPTFGANLRPEFDPDILIATNYFHNPPNHWPVLEIPENDYENKWSVLRRSNANQFLLNHKGSINVSSMFDFMEKDISSGGISFINNPVFQTYYQAVFIPVNQLLYIRIIDYTDEWHKINLLQLFEL